MSALLKRCAVSATAIAMLLFAGCSKSTTSSGGDESGAAKAPAGPLQLVTAKTAFGPIYKAALGWAASDIEILTLEPKDVPSYRFQAPVWYVAWGDKKSGFVTFVNATTGTVYKST